MKAIIFVVLCLVLPVSVFGQRSKLSQLANVQYKYSPKLEFEPSPYTVRNLEELFTKRYEPRDFISLGIKSIEDNFDSPDFVHGLSWKPDEDRTFRLKSKFSYKYSPRTLPKDPYDFLDKVFFHPVRLFVAKSLSF